MNCEYEFDLKVKLERSFPGLSLGGNLIDQWAIGVRFNIGLSEVSRAVSIYDALFRDADSVVLINEDSSWEADPARWHKLFSLPGLFSSSDKPTVRSYEMEASENEIYTIDWAIIRPSALSSERLFEAVANQDHGRAPSVRGRVHVFDPEAKILLHMYDDRGMDILATNAAQLSSVKSQFGSWINREKLGDAQLH
jgi:hypothetical protein